MKNKEACKGREGKQTDKGKSTRISKKLKGFGKRGKNKNKNKNKQTKQLSFFLSFSIISNHPTFCSKVPGSWKICLLSPIILEMISLWSLTNLPRVCA